MGLPKIEIIFKTKALTAIADSAMGIVALVLKDDTLKTFDERVYHGIEEVSAGDWTTANLDYIKMAFLGSPYEVRVQRLDANAADYNSALNRLKVQVWNYLAIPGIQAADVSTISTFIKTQRDTYKKTFKAVLPNSVSDHEGVINFTTQDIKTAAKTYTTEEFCVRFAGVFAGLGFDRSATFFVLPEVISIKEHLTPNEDIDSGQLILVHDGKKVKIGRAVNSLTTFTATKSRSFSKVAVIEVNDFVYESIKETFSDHYVGKVKNTYFNKLGFIGAVNGFLKGLADQQALDPAYANKVELDIAAQRQYLESQGISTAGLPDQNVKMMNTDSQLFLKSDTYKPLDAMEDLKFVASF